MVGTDIIIITVNIESSQLSKSLQFLPRVYTSDINLLVFVLNG